MHCELKEAVFVKQLCACRHCGRFYDDTPSTAPHPLIIAFFIPQSPQTPRALCLRRSCASCTVTRQTPPSCCVTHLSGSWYRAAAAAAGWTPFCEWWKDLGGWLAGWLAG